MLYDRLINGKSDISRVVSIEPNDGYLEVFTEDTAGNVLSQHISNKYWILANTPLNRKFIRLKGDLFYKYGIQFSDKKEWSNFRNFNRNKEIFSIYDIKEASLINKGITYHKDMDIKEPSLLSFDIEATGLKHDDSAKVLIISNTFRKQGVKVRKLFCYDEYDTEKDLIDAWCSWVRNINPSIVITFNGLSYDLPYLEYVASRSGTSLALGRDGSDVLFNKYTSSFRIDGTRDQEYKRCYIYGREIIDCYFLSIKWDIGRTLESYGLKKIISQLGLEVKNRQHYDAATIRDNYKVPEEWEKIKRYAEFDADDNISLYDLMAPAFFYLAQSVPKSYQSIILSASGSQMNAMMIRSYLQEGHSIPKSSETVNFLGAISFGIPGVYRNVLKLDINSMYPSIIRQYKIHDSSKDPEANFLKITEHFFNEKLKNKNLKKSTGDKYYADLEAANKIIANSLYGFLAAPGLVFNSPYSAAKITEYGRQILKQAIKWACGKNYEEIWQKEEDKEIISNDSETNG